MNSMLVQIAALLALNFAGTMAFANPDAVQPCSQDPSTTADINEIPANEREPLYALKTNDVIGALQFDPASGEIFSIYLCGWNSGYYYARGNVKEGQLDSFFNDEYDSDFRTTRKDGYLKVDVKSVKFSGDPEGADYPEFSTKFRFQILP